MLIAGISLQLVAGIIFGLTHILPKAHFEDANEKLKRFLLFSSRGRYRLRILLFGALAIPVASLISIYLLMASVAPSDAQWYEIIGGVLFGSLIAAICYLALLKGFARLISKTKDLQSLSDDAYFRALLFGNLILIPVLVGFTWLSFWGVSSLSITSYGNILYAIVLLLAFLLVSLGVFLVLSIYFSLVFILLAAITKLMSIMGKADKILWIIALSLFTLGGAFLIVSACQP